jgi:uncharacterized membrane protein YbhN (UPF0104 family)
MELIENPYFYTLGIILAYLLFKWGRKKLKITPDWGVVLATIFLSLFSWFCVVACLFVGIIIYLTTTKLPKPPTWL